MNQEFKKYLYNKEVTPPNDVWEAIESSLDGKPKKRKFVYWPFLTAFAIASIAIATYVYSDNKSDNESLTNEFIQKSDENSNSNQNQNKTNTQNTQNLNFEDSNLENQETLNQGNSDFQANNENFISLSNKIGNSKNSKRNPASSEKQTNNNNEIITVSSNNISSNQLNISPDKTDIKELQEQRYEEQTKTQISTNSPMLSSIDENDSISSKINENKLLKTDTLLFADNLEDSINTIVESKFKQKKKWEVSSFISPSYTRSASQDNIWLVDLYDYKGRYENATNYGLDLQYNINDKWSVRSGIESTTLKQMAYNVNLTSQDIEQVGETDIIYEGEEISIVRPIDFYTNYLMQSEIKNADVHQSISYLAVPLEFGYTFYDSKIIQMNAYLGSTTYFLQNNSISFSDGNNKIEIGSAKNLNKFVMGTQFGLQTRFKISPKFGFIFEPKFFYYFNTFNENNKVRPYTINLNTGLTFGF